MVRKAVTVFFLSIHNVLRKKNPPGLLSVTLYYLRILHSLETATVISPAWSLAEDLIAYTGLLPTSIWLYFLIKSNSQRVDQEKVKNKLLIAVDFAKYSGSLS